MKKDKSVIYFGLFFTASILAEVYCIIEKINIIGVSVIVLIAAGLFMDSLRNEKDKAEERMEASVQTKLEEIEKIQKALYVQSERNAKAVRECLINLRNTENQTAQKIIDNQLKTAKLIIKNNREDLKKVTYIGKISNEKIIGVLNKNTDKMIEEQVKLYRNGNYIAAPQMEPADTPTAIETLSSEPLEEVSHTAAGEIQEDTAPKISLDMSPEEMMAMLVSDEEPQKEKEEEQEPVKIEEPVKAEEPVRTEEPVKVEEPVKAEEPEVEAEEPIKIEEPAVEAESSNRQMSPDEIAAMFASTETAEEQKKEEDIKEEAAADPNAQMSQDDIAAMFAALGNDNGAEENKEPEEAAPAANTASDPDHAMSPEEIAALFASIGQ